MRGGGFFPLPEDERLIGFRLEEEGASAKTAFARAASVAAFETTGALPLESTLALARLRDSFTGQILSDRVRRVKLMTDRNSQVFSLASTLS